MFMTKLKKLNLEQRFPNVPSTTLKTVDKLVNDLFSVSSRFSYWNDPHISFDREEECISLEWWNQERKYKIHVDGNIIQYVAIVGTQQVRGNSLHLNHHQELREFWKWISYYVGD